MPEPLPGHATPEATRALASRHAAAAPHGHAPLGATGLVASRLGFGGYRVDEEIPEHGEALRAAIAAGCNLIDTSSNYTDGGSERLIGSVLRELAAAGLARREEIVVVSKVGYVQGENLRLALRRESDGRPFPEMVKYADGCWHCIHPEFLKDQLPRCLDRLGLERLDAWLLHNPEYYLSDAKRRPSADLPSIRKEFYRRLREAFACLEKAVGRGEIGSYGVSSNTAVSVPDDPEATSVSRMVEAAREACGPGHHFRILQIPLNLFEPGGALTRNTGPLTGQTALEAAGAAGLAVLINRPLNALVGNRLVRLADPAPEPPRDTRDGIALRLSGLKRGYRDEVATAGAGSAGAAEAADGLFRLAEQIAALPDEIEDFAHWQQVERQYILPRLRLLAGAIRGEREGKALSMWDDWWGRMVPVLRDLLADSGRRAAEKGRGRLRAIHAALDRDLPRGRRRESLSRKALWVVAGTHGVGCVLAGMRRPAYVRDATAILGWPPHPDPTAAYRRIRRLL